MCRLLLKPFYSANVVWVFLNDFGGVIVGFGGRGGAVVVVG